MFVIELIFWLTKNTEIIIKDAFVLGSIIIVSNEPNTLEEISVVIKEWNLQSMDSKYGHIILTSREREKYFLQWLREKKKKNAFVSSI